MRKESWVSLLNERMAHHQHTPFVWGRCDCWLFSMDVVDAMCGTDFKKDGYGKYKTMRGALRVMKRLYGVSRLTDMADVLFKSINPRVAGRGDLAMKNDSFGIVTGAQAVFKGEDGALVFVPLVNVDKAWRV